MRPYQKVRRFATAPFWGTLQNPEAHKNSMSISEAEAWCQREHAKQQAAQLAYDQRSAERAQIENDLRLDRELADLRALASAAPPPVLAPEMSGEQTPMFSQAELDAANFVPVPHEYPAYGQAVVASADDVSAPRPHRRRPPSLSATHKRPGRKPLAEMSALERHARKCAICRHKNREEIETDFLHWHDVSKIVDEFRLNTRRALYRHARATGLYELRMSNIRDAAALIAARAENCSATASAVLKAIQACSQIDANGRWISRPPAPSATPSSANQTRPRRNTSRRAKQCPPTSSPPTNAPPSPPRRPPPSTHPPNPPFLIDTSCN